MLESAEACGHCGLRPSPHPGANTLDEWLRGRGERALWIVETHHGALRDRLARQVTFRACRTHPSRARVPGALMAELGTEDVDTLVEALGEDVLLVDRAHRLSDRDRRWLDAAVAHGARVALRSPVLPGGNELIAWGRQLPPEMPVLDEPARRALEALAVLGDRAERELVEALVSGEDVDALLASEVVTLEGSELVCANADLTDSIVSALDETARARVADAALAQLGERDAALVLRAELAAIASDDAAALLLLDMHARAAIAEDELASAEEACKRAIGRTRETPSDTATTHVGAGFARLLAELLVRRGETEDAIDVLDEALGWIRLSSDDRRELELFRRGLKGRVGMVDLSDSSPAVRARLECDAALHRAAMRPQPESVPKLRASWGELARGQRLSYASLLLAERAIDALSTVAPEEAAELVDELLESRLARGVGVERLWQLRARLAS